MNMKSAFRMNLRAAKTISQKCRGLLKYRMLSIAVEALLPYIGIYFSAQIINELAGTRNSERLWKLVFLTIFLTALTAIISVVLKRLNELKNAAYWERLLRIYDEKFQEMDFAWVDDQKTHDLYSQIRQNDMWMGWGFNRVLLYCEKLTGALVRIISSIVLTVSLFTQKIPYGTGKIEILNHPLFVVGIIAVMLLVIVFATICTMKAE